MPKQVTCGLCQEDFPRARALRRHLALSRCSAQRRRLPAPGVMAPEAWETEPLCSVSPPPDVADDLGSTDRTVSSSPPLDITEGPKPTSADPASPPSTSPGIVTDKPETPPTLKLLMSELASEADPGAPRSPPAPASLPRRQVSVPVQVNGDWFRIDWASRRIFGDCRRPRGRIHVHLIPPSLICLIVLLPLYCFHITHFPALSDCLSSLCLWRTFHRHFLSSLLIDVLSAGAVLFLLACLLLCGDIELNPEPANFTVCTLNIRSTLHRLHSAALSDLIVSHHPDLFCLTETWIKNSTTCTEFRQCTPPNYTFLSTPRISSKGNSSTVVGGGTGFLIREMVWCILWQVNPAGVAARHSRHLEWRGYWSRGLTHAWHVDGYDKLW